MKVNMYFDHKSLLISPQADRICRLKSSSRGVSAFQKPGLEVQEFFCTVQETGIAEIL